jgi:hypothetical protein
MSGQELLQRDKELLAWWISVIHDDRFERVMVHARAELSERTLDRAQMEGANLAFVTLCEIIESEPSGQFSPRPGIDHRSVAQILKDQKDKKPEKENYP